MGATPGALPPAPTCTFLRGATLPTNSQKKKKKEGACACACACACVCVCVCVGM